MSKKPILDINTEEAERHIKNLQFHAESLIQTLNKMTLSLLKVTKAMKEYQTATKSFKTKETGDNY